MSESTDETAASDGENTRDLASVCITMIIESWRFMKVFERALSGLPEDEYRRYVRQKRWFEKKTREAMETCGITIVDFTGQAYEIGMPVSVVNMDEFGDDDANLVVDMMLEPVVMSTDGRILKTGTVSLFRFERINA